MLRFLAVGCLGIALFVACSSDDSGGGTPGSTGGSAGLGGGAGEASTSGGAAGAGTGGDGGSSELDCGADVAGTLASTEPDASDDACNACLKSECTQSFARCYATDPDSACGWDASGDSGGEISVAYGCMLDAFDNGSGAFVGSQEDVDACLVEAAAPECGKNDSTAATRALAECLVGLTGSPSGCVSECGLL